MSGSTLTTKLRQARPSEDQPLAVESLLIDLQPQPTRVLLYNVAWMVTGNVLYGLSQWAQLIVLAKLGTIDMLGTFALAMAVCLPVLMFSSLSLRSIQVTDHQRSHRFLEYLMLRLLTVIISLALIVVFGLIAAHSASLVLTTALIGAAKSVEYVSDILYGSLQQRENMSGIAVSMTLRAVLSVGALSLGVYFSHSLTWGAVCLLISSALVLVAYDIPKTIAVARLDPRILGRECLGYLNEVATGVGFKRILRLALSGLPLGLVLMLISLNLNIPRYFIQQHLGSHELAIFSAIATLLAAGSTVTNSVGQAAAPRLARYFGNRDRHGFSALLAALVVSSLGLGAFGFAGAALFGKQAMSLLYRPEYSTRQDVVLWLMGASGFFYLGSALGYAVTAVRCFTPQLPLFASATLVTTFACFVLLPSQGLPGVAIAILISAVVQCAGSAALLWSSSKSLYAKPQPQLAESV